MSFHLYDEAQKPGCLLVLSQISASEGGQQLGEDSQHQLRPAY